jgi:hypothetical protein
MRPRVHGPHRGCLPQIAANGRDEAFGNAVLPGAARRDLLRADTHAADCGRHFMAGLAVTVEDEVPRRFVGREDLAQLLDDLAGGRMFCDPEVHEPAPRVMDGEEVGRRSRRGGCRGTCASVVRLM